MKTVMFEDVKNNPIVEELILSANKCLEVRGYTEHGKRHVGYVCATTANILRALDYDERVIELGKIAGWLHDAGNSINRLNHGITGGIMAFSILKEMGMPPDEIMLVISAIGNHEEENGIPVNPISAALILADKSDAHRTRVRRGTYDPNDIHDRVNYSIKRNNLLVDKNNKKIKLVITMDDSSSPMEYFQIYMSRIIMSQKAAKFLGCDFELYINGLHINSKVAGSLEDKIDSSDVNVSEKTDYNGVIQKKQTK